MPFTEQLSQALAVVGLIPASNHTTNTDSAVAGIDMSTFRRIISILEVGAVGTNATMQLYYRASATSNMASPTNVTGATLNTTVNQGARVSTLECRADQLPSGTRYIQPVVITTTAAGNWGLIVLAGESAHKPGSALQLANTVDAAVIA